MALQDLQAMADQAAQANGLAPDLFRAVIQTESGWNPNIRSPKGAVGLGQLMPGTAQSLGVTDPTDPQQNLNASARYLASLHQQFGDENLALAAYNAGPGAVQKYGGVPPFKETHDYIQRIQSLRGNASEPRSAQDSGGRTLLFSWEKPPQAGGDIKSLQNLTSANLTGLNPDIQRALVGAASDLSKQGVNLGHLITSGFRSREDQARLYAQKQAGLNPNPVAAPGTSEHESGNAVDISMRRIPSGMQETVLSTLAKYGLARPHANDPVHFELAAGTSERPEATAPAGRTLLFSWEKGA